MGLRRGGDKWIRSGGNPRNESGGILLRSVMTNLLHSISYEVFSRGRSVRKAAHWQHSSAVLRCGVGHATCLKLVASAGVLRREGTRSSLNPRFDSGLRKNIPGLCSSLKSRFDQNLGGVDESQSNSAVWRGRICGWTLSGFICFLKCRGPLHRRAGAPATRCTAGS